MPEPELPPCYTVLVEDRGKAGVIYDTIVPSLENLRLRQHLSTPVALYKAYACLQRKGADPDRVPELEDYDPTLLDAAGAALLTFDQQDEFAQRCLQHLRHLRETALQAFQALHRRLADECADESG